VDNNKLIKTYNHQGAVLDGCWNQSDTHCFSSGLDCTIKMFNLENEKETEIGKHSKAVRCLTFKNDKLYSGSWDETVKV
jgi:WD40 repeat protein